MKWLVIILLGLLAVLQVRLWSPDGGLSELRELDQKVAAQRSANQQLKARNEELYKQVKALRNNDQAIEQYARFHLGMIKPGETFYRFVPADKK